MILWLRQLVCAHPYTQHERDDDGILQFVCPKCGFVVAAILRSPEERRRVLPIRTVNQ